MAERFKNLYRLPGNLYIDNSPVIIEAGSLLLDTETGNVLAQLKIKNVCQKKIISCKVVIKSYETNGTQIEGDKEFQYLDLNAKPGDYFGSRVPIMLNNQACRRIEVAVTEVVCADGDVWMHSCEDWRTVDLNQRPLSDIFKDREIQKQIEIDLGSGYTFAPRIQGSLFLCACGEVSLGTKCNKCNKDYDDLANRLSEETLSGHKYARLIAEEEAEKERQQKAAAEAERKAQEREARNKKIKKVAKIAGIVIACAIVLAAIIFGIVKLITDVISPEVNYNTALNYYVNSNYDDAKVIFDELGDYKDSKAMSLGCIYKKAENYERNKEYDKAISLWNTIPTYGDSEIRVLGVHYNHGIDLKNDKKYEEAIEYFQKASEYEDTDEQIQQCIDLIKGPILEEAKAKLDNGEYLEAYDLCLSISGYGEADFFRKEAAYKHALELISAKAYEKAIKFLDEADYVGTADVKNDAIIGRAQQHADARNFELAYETLKQFDPGNASTKQHNQRSSLYDEIGDGFLKSKNYDLAVESFEAAGNKDMIKEANYLRANELMYNHKYSAAQLYYSDLGDYKDSADKVNEARFGYIKDNPHPEDNYVENWFELVK